MHPDHQVKWQGTGVVTKGVPVDREIQFFGFTDYRGQGEKDTSGEGDGVDYEDYSYYEEEGMQDGKDEEDEEEEGTSSGGMSNVEKALVAAEVAMLGKKGSRICTRKKGRECYGRPEYYYDENEECWESC